MKSGRRAVQPHDHMLDLSYSDGYFTLEGKGSRMEAQISGSHNQKRRSLHSRVGSRASTSSLSFEACRRQCLESGILYEDTDFPLNNRGPTKSKWPVGMHASVIWKRPGEMVPQPKFFTEMSVNNGSNTAGRHGGSGGAESGLGFGPSRIAGVDKGEHGNGWLVTALSALALTPRLLERVVPPDQYFDEHSYCGMFRFRFWHFGEWLEVLVDDRLPTIKGRLVGVKCTDPSEFWASLLEKAYAKLYGGYENLESSSTMKALQDLTGGVVQSFPLQAQDWLVTYQVLNSAVPRSTLVIASVHLLEGKESKWQVRLRNGLITGQGYLVTGLARVRVRSSGGQEIPLVRVRNPWGAASSSSKYGSGGDWVGPWSKKSWEWENLPERDKQLLSQRVRNPGEYNAGGGPDYKQTTAVNPQFHIQIPRSGHTKCHMVVSVTQEYKTQLCHSMRGGLLDSKKLHRHDLGFSHAPSENLQAIGFAVYEVPANMTRLTTGFCVEQEPIDVTTHSVARETATFFTLPPGNYIVVPQTAQPNSESRFLLRIFTDKQTNIWEVNEDNMIFRPVSMTHFDDHQVLDPQAEGRNVLNKVLFKYCSEIDAQALMK
ncbi:unnamed protein product, partial [Notodromas monacha]